MFKYFPHTENDIKEMLEKMNLRSLDDLFSDVPENVKYKNDLDLPQSLSESELRKKIKDLSKKNKELISFLGAGSYDVYTPSVIKALTSREEFLTSYTPYQAEISQGTLAYIFEFQSIIAELTNLDISNASMYDGPTATAEAMFMAESITRRNKILVSSAIAPQTVEVLKTYAKYKGLIIEMVETDSYVTSESDVLSKIDASTAALIFQSPNYFGYMEDLTKVIEVLHNNKSIVIMNADPSTFSILKTPGEMGVDIACGEAQTLGIPLSFGGPYLGYIATKKDYMRKIPGRIVGATLDKNGRRGFVLTLQAREQHIRRDKAVSNICSNQSLMALSVDIYASIMGKSGLVETQNIAYNNAHYLYEKLIETKLFISVTDNEFLKEFVVESTLDLANLNEYLIDHGYLGGKVLCDNKYLVAVTEKRTKEELDEFLSLVEDFAHVR